MHRDGRTVRPNNSFKPPPLRGAAYFWRSPHCGRIHNTATDGSPDLLAYGLKG